MPLHHPEKFDLHCHSWFSDGSLSPQQLIQRATDNNVDVLAISDHDSVDAVKELWPQRESLPLRLIAAAEISSSWETCDIHIVALNIDHTNQTFSNFLSEQLCKRQQRGLLLVEKLETRLHIKQAGEKLQAYAKGNILCRSHVAQLIVDEGRAVDFRRAFERFLAKGKIAAVKSNWPHISESIEAINAAGGVAVLAHPTRYKLSNSRLYQLIKEFAQAGGGAVEMAYPGIKGQQQRQLARVAGEFALTASMGSDFHHPWQVWADLGKVPPLPADTAAVWETF